MARAAVAAVPAAAGSAAFAVTDHAVYDQRHDEYDHKNQRDIDEICR